jgi:hypothetical protein
MSQQDKTFWIDTTGDMGYAITGGSSPFHERHADRFLRVDVPRADAARFCGVLEQKRTAMRAMKASASASSASV